MITSTRKYGSYVLEDVGIHDIAPSSSNVVKQYIFKTNCAIPKEWISLELLEIRKYNHDTSILRFSLPEGKTRLDLPVGSFLLIKAPGCENDGRDAIRPYTSVSDDDNLVSKNKNKGSFEKDMMNGVQKKMQRRIFCLQKLIIPIGLQDLHPIIFINWLLENH
jgi:hypothetical protein